MSRPDQQTATTSSGPTRAATTGVHGDAWARAIDDDRPESATPRISLLRWSCPLPTPSGGGATPTANRSAEPRRTHLTLAPDYRRSAEHRRTHLTLAPAYRSLSKGESAQDGRERRNDRSQRTEAATTAD